MALNKTKEHSQRAPKQLIITSRAKMDRWFSTIEGSGLPVEQRADTSNEEQITSEKSLHPLTIAAHKAQAAPISEHSVAIGNDVARVMKGLEEPMRFKPHAETLFDLENHLITLLMRETPILLEVVNAQALHGRNGTFVSADRYAVELSRFSLEEIHTFIYSGRYTLTQLNNIIDGIPLEDPLIKSKIIRINGIPDTHPRFGELYQQLIHASLAKPSQLPTLVHGYKEINPTNDDLNYVFPQSRFDGISPIVCQHHGDQVFLRRSTGETVGNMVLSRHENGNLAISHIHVENDIIVEAIPHLITYFEFLLVKERYQGLSFCVPYELLPNFEAFGFYSSPRQRGRRANELWMNKSLSWGTRLAAGVR